MTFFSKWYSSSMPGAPTLNGLPGSLISLLDACLLGGFGETTASGLTVAGGLATVTFPGAHTFQQLSVVEVAGATPTALDGNKRVVAVGVDTIQFLAPGIPDGAATGTISVRLPPAGGWQKAFSGTDRAAYRCTNPLVRGNLLQVDDTGSYVDARSAYVRGYEDMVDVNNGTNPFPTLAQVAEGNGLRWMKSYFADASARPWDLVVTDRILYFFANPERPDAVGVVNNVFGDPWPTKAVSPWTTLVTGAVGNPTLVTGTGWYLGASNSGWSNAYFARAYTEVAGAAPVRVVFPGIADWGSIGDGSITALDPVAGRLWAAPVFVGDWANLVRGWLPIMQGFLHDTQPVPNGTVIPDMEGCTMYCRAFCSNRPQSNFLIDLGASE